MYHALLLQTPTPCSESRLTRYVQAKVQNKVLNMKRQEVLRAGREAKGKGKEEKPDEEPDLSSIPPLTSGASKNLKRKAESPVDSPTLRRQRTRSPKSAA